MGSAPYVCYADADDWIAPGAFDLLSAELDGHDLVFGIEAVVKNGIKVDENRWPHHLFVVRRGLDISYGALTKQDVMHKLHTLKTRYIPQTVYYWDVSGGRYG